MRPSGNSDGDQFFGRFDRGVYDRDLPREEVARLLGDFLALASLQHPSQGTASRSSERAIHENQEFWSAPLFEGELVRLEAFHLSEWAPASPGRYHTAEAAAARESAKQYYDHVQGEYVPLGKNYMFLGGVGSVRLSAKSILGRTMHLLGASSSGITHEGIPVALPVDLARDVMPAITEEGGVVASVMGTVGILPDVAMIAYDLHTPRRYLLAEEIRVVRASNPNELLATASIAYAVGTIYSNAKPYVRGGIETRLEKEWCYATFRPASDSSLRNATEWMQDYVLRHATTRANPPPILSDFDEHARHFASPIEFTFADVRAGTLDMDRVHSYEQYLGITLNIINSTVGAVAVGPNANATSIVEREGAIPSPK